MAGLCELGCAFGKLEDDTDCPLHPPREPNEWQALIDLADEAVANPTASKELG